MGLIKLLKVLVDPKLTMKKYLEDQRKIEHQLDIKMRKETILHLMSNELTSKESIEIYEEVKLRFELHLNKRLDSITWEKKCIEEFKL